MATERDRTYGIALTVALLLTLSVWMAPAAEAVPYLTAPWTPLSGSDGNDGAPYSAPWTPLSISNGSEGVVNTEPSAAAPDGNDGSGLSAPWTPLAVLDGNDGLCLSPAASACLMGDDITGPIIVKDAIGATVPEPATVILLGIGILALMFIGWRRADSLRR